MLDNSKCFKAIELCAGYAGIQLGLRGCIPNLRTVAYSEIEEFACSVLASRMENGQIDTAPIWTNLKTFPFKEFHGLVDIISGGYPCQGFSAAGKRKGKDDPRHLWPWIAEGIKACGPKICFFENVEGHISLGLSTVVSDLEELGYKVSWGIFSASEVGAPHQRKRVFILAGRKEWLADSPHELFHRTGTTGEGWRTESTDRCRDVAHALGNGRKQGRSESKGRKRRPKTEFLGKDVADGHIQGLEGQPGNVNVLQESGRIAQGQDGPATKVGVHAWPEGPGRSQFWWEPPRTIRKPERHRGAAQSPLGGSTDGAARGMDDAELYISLDNRQDELRMLGNGVVPAVAEKAFKTLLSEITGQTHQ
jgi:DNA (cytosine-5)-methyltransferase 1